MANTVGILNLDGGDLVLLSARLVSITQTLGVARVCTDMVADHDLALVLLPCFAESCLLIRETNSLNLPTKPHCRLLLQMI